MRREKDAAPRDEIRKMRLAEARTMFARADRYLGTYPGTTASALVRDLREALKNLMEEVSLL